MARICVLGGTGFVGRVLVSRLAAQGHQLRVLTRQRARHRRLLVLPSLDLIQADVGRPRSLLEHTGDVDTIINLVGILNESRSRRQNFKKLHVGLAKDIVSACHEHGIRRVIQVSALGADRNARSAYLRSKAEAEAALFQFSGKTHITSFRPSVIFGADDHFIQRFHGLLRRAPGFLPLACPDSRFAPVHVGDVVTRLCDALDDRTTHAQTLNLCGPDTWTLQELVELIARTAGLRRKIVRLSPFLSRLQARVLGNLPGKLFTIDNYRSLQVDCVCPEDTEPCPTRLEPVLQEILQNR